MTPERLWTRPLLVDGGLAVLAALFELGGLWLYDTFPASYEGLLPSGFRALTPAAVAAVVGLSLPVVLRQRAPLPALVAVTLASGAAAAILHLPLAWWASLPVLYEVALRFERRRSLAALAGVVAAALASLLLGFEGERAWLPALVVSYPPYFLIPWLLGVRARERRSREALLDARERERALRAVGDERSRVARELHDILADSISLMVAQAAGGRAVLDANADRAVEALARIETIGRGSMAEVRRLLSMLRGEMVPADVRPQRGLAQLPELLERMRGAGLEVAVTVEGDRRPLDAAVDLSAHRIIDEALINVLKHAGTAHVDVRIAYEAERLLLEVRNAGGGDRWTQAADQGEGVGLLGMRERALLLGGTLEAGPTSDDGFTVVAVLPLASAAQPVGNRS